jgi:hypothetical protein
MVIPLLPKRQDFRTIHLSCLSGSALYLLPYRRSMTCGYENYVLSGRRDIDRCVTGVIEIEIERSKLIYKT